jgi:hypothetical protein
MNTSNKRQIKSETISEKDFETSQDIISDVSKPDQSGYIKIEGYPTGGTLYPVGTVIKGRPMKVLECKMLAQADEENLEDVVNDILNRTIIGVKVDDMYTADKLYFVMWLRANTYQHSNFDVEFKCPLCKKKASYAFDVDNLRIRGFDKNTLDIFQNEFELPQSKTKVKVKALTVADEKANKKFIKDNERSLMNFDSEVLYIAKMVKEINGEEKGLIEKYMFLTEELTPSDYVYLQSFIQSKTAGLEPMVDVKCNECGGSTETVLPFQPNFFFPEVDIK